MIALLVEPSQKDLGGFSVARLLPHAERRAVGPFVFLDHLGPTVFGPGQAVDVRPHPHIGLSTLTYLFEGEILHHDNLGNDQPIRPGEVNWMTAGRGVVHSERTDPRIAARGGPMHGLQAWVALPEADEETDPGFSHHAGDALPGYSSGGLSARLVAGAAYGVQAPARTYSPLYYVHWELEAGVRGGPPGGYSENAALVTRGAVEIDGRRIEAGRLAVFGKGQTPTVTALEPSTVMLLGGETLGPRHLWWNFVSSSPDRIAQAKADWADGRMKLPAADDQAFIPLPEGPPPPRPEPMS
jgi:redox-sensitive bicupin YhaK (pirin superfamily)